MMEFSWFMFVNVFIVSLIMHEIGHFFLLGKYVGYKNIKITFRYNKSWEFAVGERINYLALSRIQLNRVYIIGFIFQFVYIFVAGIIGNWLYWLLISIAIIVSQDDFRKMEGLKLAS